MRPLAPIDPRILEEAADWLMRLHASAATEADRAACLRWRQSHPEHARAWARAELLMNKLGGLPPSLAVPALDRPAGLERRRALAKLAMLFAAVPLGWAALRTLESPQWGADHRTATGQRRAIRLSDGSQISLNTASAIDVSFDATQRLIFLREGEILIRTARDTAAAHRPFRVRTTQGQLEALGTYFSVRQEEGRASLAVFEGAVRVQPRHKNAQSKIVQAGQQSFFTADTIAPVVEARATDIAWTRGMLMADNLRLVDFLTELARYRDGFLRCDPGVADIRVAGAYPVGDTDRALAMLASTYPVEAQMRLRGYWVTILPKQK